METQHGKPPVIGVALLLGVFFILAGGIAHLLWATLWISIVAGLFGQVILLGIVLFLWK
jgi:hypothetical protein